MKAWLKGGLIGLLICILVLSLHFGMEWAYRSTSLCPGDEGFNPQQGSYNCYYPPSGQSLKNVANFINQIISFPIMNIMNLVLGKCYQVGCVIYAYIFYPLLVIEYFIIGALIGWIIGKRKSKNQSIPKQKNH